MKKFIVSVQVRNTPGVLGRISSLFGRKGYNIDSLNVSPTNDPSVSNMTVVFMGDDETEEKVLKQVAKLEDTLNVEEVKENTSVCKELALIRIDTKEKNSYHFLDSIVSDYSAKMVEKTQEAVTLELADVPSRVEEFIEKLRKYPVVKMCRTGITAMDSL